MKVTFLVHNVFGIGGTNRAVINLANELSRHHDIEIASVFRRLDAPMMAISDDIRLTSLVDSRPGSPDPGDERQRQRSCVVPPHEEFYSTYSRLTDERVRQFLRTSRRDVLVGTRAALNFYLAEWGPRSSVLIAQEHQTHTTLPPELRLQMQRAYGRLDAAVTVTEADARAFRELTPVKGLRLFSIPNSVPSPEVPLALGHRKLVLAAGRLDQVKRYDVLIHAFRTVVDLAPEWGLRIYGAGPESGRLRQLVTDLELNNRVLLMGRQTQLQAEWAKGSIAVSSSDRESFGMSIVEAMRSGLPVVSTRAPVGPEEIIDAGADGLLTPVNDPAAIATALLSLINDSSRRTEMAAAAVLSSARFDPATVAGRHLEVFEELLGSRGHPISLKAGTAQRVLRSGSALLHALTAPQLGTRAPVRGTAAETASDISCSARLDASGDIIFDLRASPRAVTEIVRLTLCDRSDRTGERPVHLPVVPLGAPGAAARVTATLPADVILDEGRWNAHVLDSAGVTHRLRYAYCDLRHAAEVSQGDDARSFSKRLPYGTDDGFLAVRSWVRGHHAECDDVVVDGGDVIVAGRLLWPGASGRASRLIARRRQSPVTEVEGRTLVPRSGEDFRHSLSMDELAARRLSHHDDWDLFVACDGLDSPARLGRLTDDIIDRRSVYRYPELRCELAPTDLAEEWPIPVLSSRLYVTVDSDISIFVREHA